MTAENPEVQLSFQKMNYFKENYFFYEKIRKVFIEKTKIPENSKNQVEFRENMYLSDRYLARYEKILIYNKPNKKHWLCTA